MAIRPLPEGLAQIAKNELNETPERIKEDLQHLREWLAKQPHLNVRNEDQWLVAFLRGCKFNLQKAKQKLETFYTLKTLSPQHFTNQDPSLPSFQELLNNGAFYLVTNRKDFVGPRIIIINACFLNYDTVTLDEVLKLCIMIVEMLLLEDDNFVVSGVSLVIDFKGLDINYLSQLTPSFFKKCVLIGIETFPLRIRNLIFINVPSFIENIIQILKMFLDNQIKERLRVFTNDSYDKLYNCIPKSDLPSEKGGECGNESNMAFSIKEKIESYTEWYIEDQKYCSDEAKRIGTPKQASDLFGIEGSFRKLDID